MHKTNDSTMTNKYNMFRKHERADADMRPHSDHSTRQDVFISSLALVIVSITNAVFASRHICPGRLVMFFQGGSL